MDASFDDYFYTICNLVPCPICGGEGVDEEGQPCEFCNGTGMVEEVLWDEEELNKD